MGAMHSIRVISSVLVVQGYKCCKRAVAGLKGDLRGHIRTCPVIVPHANIVFICTYAIIEFLT